VIAVGLGLLWLSLQALQSWRRNRR
jgi:hypothetical protein